MTIPSDDKTAIMASSPKQGIGIALSGGAARGIAHMAVLETLEKDNIPLAAIAGTSAGSVVGALYAAGMPLVEIKRVSCTRNGGTSSRLPYRKWG